MKCRLCVSTDVCFLLVQPALIKPPFHLKRLKKMHLIMIVALSLVKQKSYANLHNVPHKFHHPILFQPADWLPPREAYHAPSSSSYKLILSWCWGVRVTSSFMLYARNYKQEWNMSVIPLSCTTSHMDQRPQTSLWSFVVIITMVDRLVDLTCTRSNNKRFFKLQNIFVTEYFYSERRVKKYLILMCMCY